MILPGKIVMACQPDWAQGFPKEIRLSCLIWPKAQKSVFLRLLASNCLSNHHFYFLLIYLCSWIFFYNGQHWHCHMTFQKIIHWESELISVGGFLCFPLILALYLFCRLSPWFESFWAESLSRSSLPLPGCLLYFWHSPEVVIGPLSLMGWNHCHHPKKT